MLARRSLNNALRSKVDSSDVVQDTLVRAHERLHQFKGRTEGEMKVWLRSILVHTLSNTYAALAAQKRDVTRERSLELSLDDTSSRLDRWAAQALPSANDEFLRSEALVRLADGLNRLPSDQRSALELRYLHELQIDEISRQLARSSASVAGLLRRGLKALRVILEQQ